MVKVIQNPHLTSKKPYVLTNLEKSLSAFYLRKSIEAQIVINDVKIILQRNTKEVTFLNIRNGDKVLMSYIGFSYDELPIEITKSYYDVLIEFKSLERDRANTYFTTKRN